MDKQLKVLYWLWAIVCISFSSYSLLSLAGEPGLSFLQVVTSIAGFSFTSFLGIALTYAGGYFFLDAGVKGDRWGRVFFAVFIFSNLLSSVSHLFLFSGNPEAGAEILVPTWFSLVMSIVVGVKALFAIKRTNVQVA